MMKPMTLKQICKVCRGAYYGPADNYRKCVEGITIDSREVKPGWLFIATVGQHVDGHSFRIASYEKGALCCLGQRNSALLGHSNIKVHSSFRALRDIAEYYRSILSIPIIGVTGSVGKTGTKEMIASVLSVKYNILKTAGNLNNEVGLPLTIFRIGQEHEGAVLEMGISDFGEMHRLSQIARPDICVITNIGPCHLDALGDLDGVLKAKSEIFDFAPENARAIINGDDEKLRTLKDREDLNITFFGTDPQNEIHTKKIRNLGLAGVACEIVTPEGEFGVHIPIPGMHMVYHALAATCVGLDCGLTLEEIKTGIENIHTVDGRNHVIHTADYSILDDCYNANPVSMKASLDVLASTHGRKVAVLGDMGELGAAEKELHFAVGQYAAEKHIDLLLCVGELSAEIIKGAKSADPDMRTVWFDSKEKLLEKLPELLIRDDSILVKASHFMEFDKIVKALEG